MKWQCPCSESDARALLDDAVRLALAGRDIDQLPAYVEHYLFVLARMPRERSRD